MNSFALPVDAQNISDALISIIVPVFDEEAVIELFHARLSAVMESLGAAWEVIYVNDGSRDRSLQLLVDNVLPSVRTNEINTEILAGESA